MVMEEPATVESIRHANFWVIDTETTGLDAATDAVVEVAGTRVHGRYIPHAIALAGSFAELVNPGRPIPPDKTQIHGVTDADVRDKPALTQVAARIQALIGDSIVVAHRAEVERAFLPFLSDRRWLCTQLLAKTLWPHLRRDDGRSAYSLQTLRERFRLDARTTALALGDPHQALADVKVTAQLLMFEIAEYLNRGCPDQLEALLAIAVKRPVDATRVSAGRFDGHPMADVPAWYLRWALRTLEFDAELHRAFAKEWTRRLVLEHGASVKWHGTEYCVVRDETNPRRCEIWRDGVRLAFASMRNPAGDIDVFGPVWSADARADERDPELTQTLAGAFRSRAASL